MENQTQVKGQEKKLSLNSKKIAELSKFMVKDTEFVNGGVLGGCHSIDQPTGGGTGCDRLTGGCGSLSGW